MEKSKNIQSRMKKILLPLFLFSLLVTALVLLPSLLSSAAGKKFLLAILSKKFHQQIDVGKIHFSWFGPQTWNQIKVTSDNFELSFEEFSSDLPFWKLANLTSFSKKNLSSFQGKTTLTNGELITYLPESHFTQLNFIFSHEKKSFYHVEFEGKGLEGGQLFLNFLSDDIDLSKASLSITAQDLPSIFLDRFVPFFFKVPEAFFSSLLGEKIQLKSSSNLFKGLGSIEFSLSSPFVSTKMQGEIQEGVLTLSEDMHLDVFLTETFSRYFLKEMSPLFLSAHSSQKPIHLILYKEGFELPLSPFSVKEMKVQKAILDLGQIRAKNANGLALIMGIMKLHLPSNIEEMDIWTTPVTLSLYDGSLYTDRMDALLDHSLHICTWGTIDLLTEEVEMTLGLTAEALQETFRFANLPEDYVMTIPIRGNINHVTIDNAVATAKIAKLMAMKATNTGLLNKLFGSILQEENIPPPKRPFPWEGKEKKSSSQKEPLDNLMDLFH
jgi:hypothetical protein